MSYTESYYAILGISEDASHQEIKQAYKKAALRTHPDRALPERKAEAETNFKKVAEAYETLSEPGSRDRYDRYGTATSPPPFSSSSSSRRRTHTDDPGHTYFGVSPDSKPFSFQWESSYDSAKRAQAQRGDGSRRPFNHGIDPFQLFNEMFAREFSSMHNGGHGGRGDDMFDNHPFFANHRRMADTGGFGFGSPFGTGGAGFGMQSSSSMMDTGMGGFGFDSPFATQGSYSMAATRRDPFGSSAFGPFSNMMTSSMQSSSMSMGGAGGGQSESRSTRTINGRTETIIKRVDAQGNQTVHTITPEGQNVHVNGVEQPNHPLLQQGSAAPNRAPLPPTQG